MFYDFVHHSPNKNSRLNQVKKNIKSLHLNQGKLYRSMILILEETLDTLKLSREFCQSFELFKKRLDPETVIEGHEKNLIEGDACYFFENWFGNNKRKLS